MVYCHNCGAQHPEGIDFCTKCGSKLLQETQRNEELTGRNKAVDPYSISLNSNLREIVPNKCRGCFRFLSPEQINQNIQSYWANRYNIIIILLMLSFLLVGSALIIYSIMTSGSSWGSSELLLVYILSVALLAIPFIMLAIKKGKLFIKVEGTCYFCPDCLEKMAITQSQTSGKGQFFQNGALGRSLHYVNDVENGTKGAAKFFVIIMIPGLIFGLLYGSFVKNMSLESNALAMLLGVALMAGIFLFVIWGFKTPRFVVITPISVEMELKNGRKVNIPFEKLTWVSVLMDVRKYQDPSKAVGQVIVGKFRLLQITYTIRRDIVLDLREVYRANRGIYPPNGLESWN